MKIGIKQRWKDFLDRIAKSNAEQFGQGTKLNCCDLAKPKDGGNTHKTGEDPK
ncbi:LDCC motif putative metal-binding protein [Anaerotalea alkaliphila]|uniref:Uncharacterized protein n=1 Tax=Anaerotalea alkaliphila TaxID=2662126 RepID=A0A7X5KNH4_9FIRM|nr:LDCC motif putative metal-binding protein [Anaerotalea alkaliphila]NDL67803.1 hypothetical protein [Anaerotalea alkaliphila]